MTNILRTPIYEPERECASREEIRSLQLERLQTQVRRAYDCVAWYKQSFDTLGIHPDDIKELEDIHILPFTTKLDLRDTFPFGLFAVPLDEVVRLHSSSGTTGKPIVVGYTANDLDIWSSCIARMVQQAGVVPEDRIQMAFGYGMFTGGFGLHYGLERLGCMVIPAAAGNTERHIMMIEDYGSTVLIATPSYALHMCEVGEKLGYDWKKSQLRVGLFGGEPCREQLRNEIESRMHIICTDNYGLTEVMGPGVGGQCLASIDQNHLAEDHFLWEVIDPETGEVLPEGAEGELVLTPLTKEAFPVLRYRTRDLTRITTEPCPCGRTHARMDKVRSRTDDMLIVRGTNVFPSQIEDVLGKIEGVSTYYRIVLDNEKGLDRMTVIVELDPRSPLSFSDSFEETRAFNARVADKIKQTLLMSVVVKFAEPGSITRSLGKTQHVEDRRIR